MKRGTITIEVVGMGIIESLQETMQEAEDKARHDGYWYRIRDALTIMVCGMLSSFQNIGDIHEWSQAAPVRVFFENKFGIDKVPSRAQFYNIIACVDSEKFSQSFTKWMQVVL